MHPQISTFVEGIVRVHSGDHNASTSSGPSGTTPYNA